MHLDATPVIFDHFLEALSVRKRVFLAHLDGDGSVPDSSGGSDPFF